MQCDGEKIILTEREVLALGIPRLSNVQPVEKIDEILERAVIQDRLASSNTLELHPGGVARAQRLAMITEAQANAGVIGRLTAELVELKQPDVADAANLFLKSQSS